MASLRSRVGLAAEVAGAVMASSGAVEAVDAVASVVEMVNFAVVAEDAVALGETVDAATASTVGVEVVGEVDHRGAMPRRARRARAMTVRPDGRLLATAPLRKQTLARQASCVGSGRLCTGNVCMLTLLAC